MNASEYNATLGMNVILDDTMPKDQMILVGHTSGQPRPALTQSPAKPLPMGRDGITAELINRGSARFHLGKKNLPETWAAVGRNHPDYGMTASEHEQMKWARAQGWTEVQSLEAVTTRVAEMADVEGGAE